MFLEKISKNDHRAVSFTFSDLHDRKRSRWRQWKRDVPTSSRVHFQSRWKEFPLIFCFLSLSHRDPFFETQEFGWNGRNDGYHLPGRSFCYLIEHSTTAAIIVASITTTITLLLLSIIYYCYSYCNCYYCYYYYYFYYYYYYYYTVQTQVHKLLK